MFDHENKSTFPNGRNKKQPIVPIISPSLMVADQTRLLGETLHVLSPEGGSVEWIHVDIVDGHFAHNFSFCPKTVSDLRRHLPHTFLDVHFIAKNPAIWVEPFAKAGASSFVFHVETTDDAIGVCRKIRQAGMMAGVALCEATPVEALFPVLDAGEADMALVMTVKSGFAGQSFKPAALEKVRVLRQRYPHLTIQVDGSITLETIGLCAEAGANAIVPGRAVFKSENRRESVQKLRSTIQKHINQRAQSHL
ncbi:putative ribulose-phosphate 3-epimerase [Leptomonas seymouri]|uniref:ribulose-phosphate 3-epimerase n=1 Tax=Leptomonas seymouri TaxID=5684 RepID=A0A0N0P4Y1_LEPSE|nr:putative ribulose-phosphate 3-epimerase [Leptomonas seymouri]|eukprot:KPI85357.1 putative ribulose-phosphate 3-epimerase [Leptomonas seymouri]